MTLSAIILQVLQHMIKKVSRSCFRALYDKLKNTGMGSDSLGAIQRSMASTTKQQPDIRSLEEKFKKQDEFKNERSIMNGQTSVTPVCKKTG